jgi:hypothetical protein
MTNAEVTRLTVHCQKGCERWWNDGNGTTRSVKKEMTYAGTRTSGWWTYHVFVCLSCGCKREFYLAEEQRLEEYVK